MKPLKGLFTPSLELYLGQRDGKGGSVILNLVLNLFQYYFRIRGGAGSIQDSGMTNSCFMKQYYVYILTNKSNRVLYIGVTNNLIRRILEHKKKEIKGFTQKYNCTKLVYYEATESVDGAIEREKQLKNWHRQWKINLITENNPDWEDLAEKQDLLDGVED